MAKGLDKKKNVKKKGKTLKEKRAAKKKEEMISSGQIDEYFKMVNNTYIAQRHRPGQSHQTVSRLSI